MPALCVNIDHVATVRQARRTWEPDPAKAAEEACLGGADGITIHLREDRRHIQDSDLHQLAGALDVPLNLEMAATREMVEISLQTRPDMAMLVPEGRQEITTEGGLDVAGRFDEIKQVVQALQEGGIRVSAFIDAEEAQVAAANACGFDVCEIHTGPYAHAFHEHDQEQGHPDVQAELDRVCRAGELIHGNGMCFNAGHGLTIWNVGAVAALPRLHELHIGHSIISRSIFTGLRTAVADMKKVITDAAVQGATLDA